MNRLGKYLTIVYLVLLILTIAGYITESLYNNYVDNNVPESQYDSSGNQLLVSSPTNTASYLFKEIFWTLSFIGFPLLVLVMGAIYVYKEKGEYKKSLLISLPYLVLGFLFSFIWLAFFAVGEEGMLVLILWPLFFGTFIFSLIVNGIVYKIVKKQ